jgi:Glycine zipper 2TM domain
MRESSYFACNFVTAGASVPLKDTVVSRYSKGIQNMCLKRIIVLALASAMLVSCGGSQSKGPSAAETAAAEAATAAQAAAAAADEAARKKAEADAAAAAATREAQLALQQSELKAQERDLAQREAKLEKERAAAKKESAAKPAAKPPAATPAAVAVPAKPVPKSVTVPAGTALNFALASDLNTKSAKIGDTFRAKLTSDVVIDGHVAVPSGTVVVGQVTKVVSGSQQIGATPTISLRLDSLEYSGGKTLPISGEYTSTGKSEKGQDTAKIVGGAAAGAILGHQVNNKSSGTIIGGLLGAGAGTLVAKNTGSEVKLPAGTEVSIALATPLKVQVN